MRGCLLLFSALALTACNGGGGEVQHTNAPTAASPTTAAPASASAAGEEARTVFNQRCSVCHGMSGKGDGPGAVALNPKPRDYTNAEWQKSVSDDDLKKIIVQGGQAVGKSMMMPPNPDLAQKPEVVEELVHIVRSFNGK